MKEISTIVFSIEHHTTNISILCGADPFLFCLSLNIAFLVASDEFDAAEPTEKLLSDLGDAFAELTPDPLDVCFVSKSWREGCVGGVPAATEGDLFAFGTFFTPTGSVTLLLTSNTGFVEF